MTESRDSRISELYRQSSQETPPAHLDHVVMDMARKSIRRRVVSPFGNHWIAGGATVGVVMLSVLLILSLPQQPESPAPEYDAQTLSSDSLSAVQEAPSEPQELRFERSAGVEEERKVPAAPKMQLDFYNLLPEAGVIIPEEENRARLEQRSAPVEKSAGLASPASAGPYYLQVGAFRDKERADQLKTKLVELEFACDIQKVRKDDKDILYRVRVGPYDDLVELEKSRYKLQELGIEALTVNHRE